MNFSRRHGWILTGSRISICARSVLYPPKKAIDEIMEHIGILGEHPYAGPLHPDPVLAKQEYRKLVLTKTYIAVYRVIGDTVYIYRVVNGKTDYPSLFK